MLEKVDLKRKMDKEKCKTICDTKGVELAALQRACKEAGIPVIIVFEGLDAAGKGTQINKLIEYLDPRGFQVFATNRETEEEKLHSFLWRFFTKTPENGRIAIFDRSWYCSLLGERLKGHTKKKQVPTIFRDISAFERQLSDDGTVIIKFFLYISKKEQKKRFDSLKASKETRWRVTKDDEYRNQHYKEYLNLNEEMLENTDFEYAPWTIVEATSKEYASAKIINSVVDRLKEELEKKANEKSTKESIETKRKVFQTGALSNVDLSKSLTKEEYKKELKQLQKRLSLLHSEIYRLRIPVILAFEGWDAGGKGGAIKRLTSCLDPRGYQVNPTASPNDIEKKHHYLWRFWNAMPKNGHIAIFDRTWYGRVMVERIEGFCSENEWKRAYQEMNEMEKHLADSGAVVLKFWMHIDKDEQERRFKERMEIPEKQWKITDEDWRNREKWDEYEEAVDEMIVRTSTLQAPWIIVEANSKYYARIKVLKTVVNALEKKIKECN